MMLKFWGKTCLLGVVLFGSSLAGCQNNQDLIAHHPVKAVKTVKASTVQRVSVSQGQHKLGYGPLQTKLTQYLVSHDINGTVAVVKNKKILFNEGLGYANILTGEEDKPSTTYPLASVTKSMVATSIMQLQEQGKLSIYDPLSKYLPHFPNGKNIKLIHLLDHTSGINPPPHHQGITTPLALIKRIEQRPVLFVPGTKWSYHDENYAILGYILQEVTGESLHTYIQNHIFDQAGMKSTGFINQGQPANITAVGYKKNGSRLISGRVSSKLFLFGFSDIYSTAYDLCLYDEALMNGKLVSKKTLHQMLIPRSISHYGIGLYNVGYSVQSHGIIGGYESFHAIFKDGTYVSILLNLRDKLNNVHTIGKQIDSIVASSIKSPSLL